MRNNIYIILLCIVAFFSCEKPITIDIKDEGRKITLNGILTGDSTLYISLTQSQHILNGSYNYPPIDNATITLFENNVEIESVNQSTEGWYHLNTVLNAGSKYRVAVDYAGLENVSAESMIPLKADIELFEYEINTTNELGYETIESIDFKLSFNDNPGEKNFYQVQMSVLEHYEYEDPETGEIIVNEYTYPIHISTYDPSIAVAEHSIPGLIFNDDIFDGKSFTLNFYIENFYYDAYYTENIKYFVTLNTISEELYKYYLSYTKYTDAVDNPFAEPVKVYSNIENGFGILGGESTDIDSITVVVDLPMK